ncbi:hypothetical protein [Phenylobacterium sp.]|uniref:hypothetical protein n=1 Tax=Phenylobacterium sp. TaxID=1871053 RepID=UPI002734E424|nr:hypothetical protein [Phenylobacterium sp.]
MTRRLQQPFSVAHYGSASVELLQSYVEMFATVQPTFYGPEFDRTGLTDLNRDLFPRDEFMTPAAD